MKKIFALILSLALMTGCLAAASGEIPEVSEKTVIGTVSINGAFTLQMGIPEGYTPRPVTVSPEYVEAVLENAADPAAPVMELRVAYDESYSDVERMNDLDEQDLALLEDTYREDTVEISYAETGLGTKLLVVRQKESLPNYIDFLSIYQGYFIEFMLTPGPGAADQTLSDEQLRLCVDFLTDLDFVPAEEADEAAPAAEEARWEVILRGANETDRTLTLDVMRDETMAAETAEALKVGDQVKLGTETVVIETLDQDEFGFMINDEYELRKQEDGSYLELLYESNIQTVADTLTVKAAESFTLEDGIDPATGEALEEPTVHSWEEFLQMLNAGEETTDPGFATQNVSAEFNERGEVTKLIRFYVPWQ